MMIDEINDVEDEEDEIEEEEEIQEEEQDEIDAMVEAEEAFEQELVQEKSSHAFNFVFSWAILLCVILYGREW